MFSLHHVTVFIQVLEQNSSLYILQAQKCIHPQKRIKKGLRNHTKQRKFTIRKKWTSCKLKEIMQHIKIIRRIEIFLLQSNNTHD